MLCFEKNKHGDICTNRCELWQGCAKRTAPFKIPFLIEASDRLVSDIIPERRDGLNIINHKFYSVAPQAYINGVIDDINTDDMC